MTTETKPISIESEQDINSFDYQVFMLGQRVIQLDKKHVTEGLAREEFTELQLSRIEYNLASRWYQLCHRA